MNPYAPSDKALRVYVEAFKFFQDLMEEQKAILDAAWNQYVEKSKTLDKKIAAVRQSKNEVNEAQIDNFYANLRLFIESNASVTLNILKETR